MNMEATQKVCTNGHRMEPDWEVCPYCPSARAGDPALARTVKVDATRMEAIRVDAARPSSPPPVSPSPRHTEIIRRDPMPAGIGWLVAAAGPSRGKTHRIDAGRATIGAAANCDVALEGDHISDRHASVRFHEGGFLVTDLDSTNGTFVNGEPVQQRALADGDRLTLGTSEWIFKCVVFNDS